MIDFSRALSDVQQTASRIDPSAFLVAIVASLVASVVASALYIHFYERRGAGSQVHRAFPLLGLSITTLFVAVQVSLPLSLGLLGALSIVRFRTPIKEPEEIGFIMLVIASSITCATFNFMFLVLLYGVAVLTLFAAKGWGNRKFAARDGILIATITAKAAEGRLKEIEACAGQQACRCFLESSSLREGVLSLQFSFSGMKGGIGDFQSALAKVAEFSSLNIFLNRPAGG